MIMKFIECNNSLKVLKKGSFRIGDEAMEKTAVYTGKKKCAVIAINTNWVYCRKDIGRDSVANNVERRRQVKRNWGSISFSDGTSKTCPILECIMYILRRDVTIINRSTRFASNEHIFLRNMGKAIVKINDSWVWCLRVINGRNAIGVDSGWRASNCEYCNDSYIQDVEWTRL